MSRAEYQREWYRNNPDKIKQKTRRYRDNHTLTYLITCARGRAKKQGIEFTITEKDIVVPEVCPIFKTSFVYKTPQAMSLDRIDSSKGYIPGNVQVISFKANMMKSNATREDLVMFAKWIMNV